MGRGQLPSLLRRRRARPVVRLVSRAFTAIERWSFRAGRTLVGSRVAGGAPVLLLTTTGRRTGRRRMTPLLYARCGAGELLMVGANGGADWDPDWLHNLRADPNVVVQIGREHLGATATVLDGEHRAAAWPTAVTAFATLESAQAACRREIPLVRVDLHRQIGDR